MSIDNLIKLSTMNSMNIQLKNINFLLNSVNEDIKKIDELIISFNNIKDTIEGINLV